MVVVIAECRLLYKALAVVYFCKLGASNSVSWCMSTCDVRQPAYMPVNCQMTPSAEDVSLLHRFHSTTFGGRITVLDIITHWLVWWSKV